MNGRLWKAGRRKGDDRVLAYYTRISTEDGEDKTWSIESQIRENDTYAMKAFGRVADRDKIYTDEYTGMKWDRPAFNRLKADITSGLIDVVIVLKANRIARRSDYAQTFLFDYFFDTDAELHIAQWNSRVTNGKTDVLRFQIETDFGQYEHADILERTARGRKEKMDGNVWLGQGTMILGYQKIGKKKDMIVEVHDSEAELVMKIFTAIGIHQVGPTEIARILDMNNAPTVNRLRGRRTSDRWTPRAIRRIIQDPRYKGEWHQLRYITVKAPDTKRKLRQFVRPEAEWIRYHAENLRIVPDDLWQLANDAIHKHTEKNVFSPITGRFAPKHGRFYLMGNGRLKCMCKEEDTHKAKIMARQLDNHRGWVAAPEYVCYAKAKGDGGCGLLIEAALVDEAIWLQMLNFIYSPEATLALLKDVQAEQASTQTIVLDEVINIDDRIKDLEDQRRQKRTDLKVGRITREEYEEDVDDIVKRIKTYQNQRTEHKENLEGKILTNREIDTIINHCTKLRELIEDPDNECGGNPMMLSDAEKAFIIEQLNVQGKFMLDENGKLVIGLTARFHAMAVVDAQFGQRRVLKSKTDNNNNKGGRLPQMGEVMVERDDNSFCFTVPPLNHFQGTTTPDLPVHVSFTVVVTPWPLAHRRVLTCRNGTGKRGRPRKQVA